MSNLCENTKQDIYNLLINTVKSKLIAYKPETSYMPFHYRLLGKDRYAMFSFMQSMNTTFGISVWEQIAVILAKGSGSQAERQYDLLGEIDISTANLINKVSNDLRIGVAEVNKIKETELIRNSIKSGNNIKQPDSRVDVFIKRDNQENYIDITSVKPNLKEFAVMKEKLLKWTALRLSQDKTANVVTRLAVPYNPYHPEPYQRWTLKGLYDLEFGEILVGEEFWNFCANNDIYEELLNIFSDAGNALREELNEKFKEFK